MSISYDLFTEAFLSKITEYNFIEYADEDREKIIDNYMKRAINKFNKTCKYDFCSTKNDILREFEINIPSEDIDEIIDIISEGMLIEWMKPFVYNQELLQNTLNTKDFTTYSPG